MKKFVVFLVAFLMMSCASGGKLGCMKKKPHRQKYRVKKLKKVDRPAPIYSASSGNSSRSEPVDRPDYPPPGLDEAASLQEETVQIDEVPIQESTSTPRRPGPTTPVPNPMVESAIEDIPKPVEIEDLVPEEILVEPVNGESVDLDIDEVPPVVEPEITPIENEQTPIQPIEVEPIPEDPLPTPVIEEVVPVDDVPKPVETEINEPEEVIASNPLNQSEGQQVNVSLEKKPEVIVNFREEEINISEGYSFNEYIPFLINQDVLLYPEEAMEKIQDLADLLIDHPEVSVTIIANTATDEPHYAHNDKYGGDEETLTTMWESVEGPTGGFANLKELMTGRGRRVAELLIERGVSPDQLSYRHGTHNMWKYQRVLTFVLNDGE